MATKNLPMREALRRALMEEMHRDEKVFIMGEEVAYWQGTHRVTRGFLEEFGEKRVRDAWRQKDLGRFASEFKVTVPPHGAELVRVSR